MSAFERRQAELRKQIAELEEENVAPKPWAARGEATAKSRPADSLLAEDLDFERTTRPTPAMTAERVSSIEEMVKTRILEVWLT